MKPLRWASRKLRSKFVL